MKTLILFALLTPLAASASTVYRCGNLYTDNVKLCNNPTILNIDATPPTSVAQPCTPNTCTISKENK